MIDCCDHSHSLFHLKDKMRVAGLRLTPMRLLILHALDNSHNPLSALDLEIQLDSADRSTISRSLATFLEHDLIHAIDDGSGSIKYEVCRSEHHHSLNDLHVHFHCTVCDKTFCLPASVPQIELPKGFTADNLNYVVAGKCPKCAAKG